MPTTLLNAALGLVPDRGLPVRGPDRLTAVVPMFDEELGAGRALTSLLDQREPVDEVVVSINGGRDRTPEVVAATLAAAGYACEADAPWGPSEVPRWRWRGAGARPPVVVLVHPRPVSKADSINLVVAGGLVSTERVLVMDGDTVLDDGFVAALRDAFYRLRPERHGGRMRWVLEDLAVQSGAVTSLWPVDGGAAARLVSAARSAEYAFATLMRRGQTARLGSGPTFGASRLYTVVGCGFVARRAAFPMPSDTMTEDHDFTLQVQEGGSSERAIEVDSLHARGFRVVVDGRPRPLADVIDDASLTWRTTCGARFEAGATMRTEDPPRLSAYVGQIERWIGGGLENGLKRLVDPERRRSLTPNVRFTVLAAQLENLVGMLLFLALPAALGLWWPWAGSDAVLRGVGAWLLADAIVTGALVALGAFLQARAGGGGRATAAGVALRRVALGVLPLLLLRPLNAVAYATAATRVVPRFVLRSLAEPSVNVTWERPRAIRKSLRSRTAAVGSVMVTLALAGFLVAARVSADTRPIDTQAWRDLHAGPRVDLMVHAVLPTAVAAVPAVPAHDRRELMVAAEPPTHAGGSTYCGPTGVAASADVARRFDEAAPAYQPLSPWGVLTLARLAPIGALVEEAASAYDIPPVLLLQLLLNESYLDPLAVGPTDDLGLSQVTSDTLSLLRRISTTRGSRFENRALFAGAFSAFDPDFSICAGAAKLAWVRELPNGDDDEIAYARYINPLDGVVDGHVSARHRPLVDAFVAVRPMAEALAGAIVAYRVDRLRVTPVERTLLDLYHGVDGVDGGVELAYRRLAGLAEPLGIRDPGFYARVVAGLYGEDRESAAMAPFELARSR